MDTGGLKTNFTSEKPAEYYAQLYREHNLTGAHVVMLGPGCQEAALDALKAWPGTSFTNLGLIKELSKSLEVLMKTMLNNGLTGVLVRLSLRVTYFQMQNFLLIV